MSQDQARPITPPQEITGRKAGSPSTVTAPFPQENSPNISLAPFEGRHFNIKAAMKSDLQQIQEALQNNEESILSTVESRKKSLNYREITIFSQTVSGMASPNGMLLHDILHKSIVAQRFEAITKEYDKLLCTYDAGKAALEESRDKLSAGGIGELNFGVNKSIIKLNNELAALKAVLTEDIEKLKQTHKRITSLNSHVQGVLYKHMHEQLHCGLTGYDHNDYMPKGSFLEDLKKELFARRDVARTIQGERPVICLDDQSTHALKKAKLMAVEDHGKNTDSSIHMRVLAVIALLESGKNPIIHCKWGMGRTGLLLITLKIYESVCSNSLNHIETLAEQCETFSVRYQERSLRGSVFLASSISAVYDSESTSLDRPVSLESSDELGSIISYMNFLIRSKQKAEAIYSASVEQYKNELNAAGRPEYATVIARIISAFLRLVGNVFNTEIKFFKDSFSKTAKITSLNSLGSIMEASSPRATKLKQLGELRKAPAARNGRLSVLVKAAENAAKFGYNALPEEHPVACLAA